MLLDKKIRFQGDSKRTGTATQTANYSVGCRDDVTKYDLVPYNQDGTDHTSQITAYSLTDSNCIFYNQSGSDTTGTGTQASPVFSPSKAAELATSGSKANCCFNGNSAYTYDDSIVIGSAINWYSDEFDCTINQSGSSTTYTRQIVCSTKNLVNGRVYALTTTELILYTINGETVLDSGLVDLCSISSYLDGVVGLSWSTGNVYRWDTLGNRTKLFTVPACSSKYSQVSATDEAIFVLRNGTAVNSPLYGWDGSTLIEMDISSHYSISSSLYHSENSLVGAFSLPYSSLIDNKSIITCSKINGLLSYNIAYGNYNESIKILNSDIYALSNNSIYVSNSLTDLNFEIIKKSTNVEISLLESYKDKIYYYSRSQDAVCNIYGEIVQKNVPAIRSIAISNDIMLTADNTDVYVIQLSCLSTYYNVLFNYYKFAGGELSTPISNDSSTLEMYNCSVETQNPIINSYGNIILNNSLFSGSSSHIKSRNESASPSISNCILKNAQTSIDSDSEVILSDCTLTYNSIAIDAPTIDATRCIFAVNGQDAVITADSTVNECVISRWTGADIIGEKYSSNPNLTNYLGLKWDARNLNPYADGGSLDFTEDLGAWKFDRTITIGSPEIDVVLPISWDNIDVSYTPANYNSAIAPSGEYTDWFSNSAELKRQFKISWNKDTGDKINTWNHFAYMTEIYSRQNAVFRFGFDDGSGGWQPIKSFTAYAGVTANTVSVSTVDNIALNELKGFYITFGSDSYRITSNTQTATGATTLTLDTDTDLSALSGAACHIEFIMVKIERGAELAASAQKYFSDNLPVTGYSLTVHESEIEDGGLL